jgi:hypothetical protein
MTIRIFALALLSLLSAFAQDPVEGADRLPWENMGHQYCAVRRVYQKVGPFVFPFYTDVPIPNKEISVTTLMRSGTDWHTHQVFDSVQRPVGTYKTPIVGNTVLGNMNANGVWVPNPAGTEACVSFVYKNAGFSGIIDTVMTPTDPALVTTKWFNRLKVSDHDVTGNAYPLEPIRPNSYTGPLTTPIDNRHWDQNGQPGYSRYGGNSSVHMMKVMMYAFGSHAGTYGLIPRILRGSLPNGGYADNQVGAGGSGPLFPSWDVRIPQETHQYGMEWDIENPAVTLLSLGHTPAESADIWLVFKAAVTSTGCRFGKLNPDTGLPMTDGKDTSNQWVARAVVHLNCLFVPE